MEGGICLRSGGFDSSGSTNRTLAFGGGGLFLLRCGTAGGWSCTGGGRADTCNS
jgi:hypothetical protein